MKQKNNFLTVFYIAVALCALAAAYVVFIMPRTEKAAAKVLYKGGELMTINLSKDAVYHIEAELPVTLEVVGGKIHFINSLCPDHTCESFGLISREGESATCMPAQLVVTIPYN